MLTAIQEKFQKYLEIQKQLAESRKQQKEWRKEIDSLESDIKEYMTKNDMDSISLKEGEIVLYAKKISQTFKKEVIMEKLNEKLKDTQKAEELTQSILQNKSFIVEDKIKAIIKKKK
jgi:DNA repair ATPase RecN